MGGETLQTMWDISFLKLKATFIHIPVGLREICKECNAF